MYYRLTTRILNYFQITTFVSVPGFDYLVCFAVQKCIKLNKRSASLSSFLKQHLAIFICCKNLLFRPNKPFTEIYHDFYETISEGFWIGRRISGGKNKSNGAADKGTKMICLSGGIVGLYSSYVHVQGIVKHNMLFNYEIGVYIVIIMVTKLF